MTGLPGVEARFRQLKQSVQRQLHREHRKYVHNLLNDPTEETSTINKRFWTYVKHRRSDCGGLTALRVNNMLVTDSKLKADALNQQFQSVFSAKTNTNKSKNSDSYQTDMRQLHVGREGVLKLLRELKTNRATGLTVLALDFLKSQRSLLQIPWSTSSTPPFRLEKCPKTGKKRWSRPYTKKVIATNVQTIAQ